MRAVGLHRAVATGTARIALVQDTYDCTAAYSQLRGVDVLIHECTYDAALADKALLHGHSTAAQAGRVAADVGAGMLILTHFSARYGAGKKNRREMRNKQQQQQQHEQTGQQGADVPEEAETEERKLEFAAISSSAAVGMTTDELVQEAADAYVEAKSVDAAACLPIYAAEDFLVFERHGAEFQIRGYDRTASKLPPVSTEAVG